MGADCYDFKYSGIATFMRSPYVPTGHLECYDAAVLGVPIDHGVSFREGAKYAPRIIREHSSWDRIERKVFYDFDTGNLATSTPKSLADTGDIFLQTGNAEETNEAIVNAVAAIRRQTFPLILGGDHSITYGTVRGCLLGLEEERKPIGILHFDAHTDLDGKHPNLPRVWHGNCFRALIEEGHVAGENLATIGLRGLSSLESVNFAQKHGVGLFPMGEIRRNGLSNVIKDCCAKLSRTSRSIFISLDIDCIDPSEAPGTGTPEPGGLHARELLSVLPELVEVPIIGLDVTEVNPALDPSGLTAVITCEFLWRFLMFSLPTRTSPPA